VIAHVLAGPETETNTEDEQILGDLGRRNLFYGENCERIRADGYRQKIASIKTTYFGFSPRTIAVKFGPLRRAKFDPYLGISGQKPKISNFCDCFASQGRLP